jgi:hypothetical protein
LENFVIPWGKSRQSLEPEIYIDLQYLRPNQSDIRKSEILESNLKGLATGLTPPAIDLDKPAMSAPIHNPCNTCCGFPGQTQYAIHGFHRIFISVFMN